MLRSSSGHNCTWPAADSPRRAHLLTPTTPLQPPQLQFAPSRSKLREKFPKVALHGSTPPLTDAGFDLLARLLALDPAQRISAQEALEHPWFAEPPRPKAPIEMPTFAEKRK